MLSLRSLSLSFLFPILGVVSSGGEAIAQEGSKAPLYDLDNVSGCEHFPQDPGLRALLAKNGFAVIPMFHTQIFSPYLCTDLLPPLVTVESAIRTYQVMLEEGPMALRRIDPSPLTKTGPSVCSMWR